jgi:hypothetical protein
MSTHTHVPADDEATSIIDLVEDCREVSGVLAPYLPVEIRLPDARAAMPVEIDEAVATGWRDY